MSLYTCKIGAADGSIQHREFEAVDDLSLRKNLEDQGFYVFSVKRKPLQFLFDKGFKRRTIDNRALLTFNQEMLVLVKAGMPIMQVLDAILERHDNGYFSEVLQQVREDIKGGTSLSSAMERHGSIFPHLYIASIKAGERTGDLPHTIRRYIQYLKRVDSIRKKVVAALFYPIILVVFALMAVILLLLYVVPTFAQVYADSGALLPLPTRILIDITSFIKQMFPFVILLGATGFWFFRSWRETESGRYKVDYFKLTVPFAGDIFLKYSVSGFTRTLSTVLGSGIPIVESLRMSIGTLNNRYMEKKLYEVVRYIEEGGKLSKGLERISIMPPLALRMLGVGETTGALEDMLVDIADYLEDELEERMQKVTTGIEPAIMVIMGVIIGAIIVAMYLPIFKIAGTVG